MRITKLAFLAFYLNGAADSGKYDNLSKREVYKHVEAGTILDFLQERLGHDIDLSLLDDKDRRELLETWQDMANAIDSQRKFGVSNRGVNLLVAYLLEMIQRTQDNNPAR